MERKDQELYKKLIAYADSPAYPFHMPGHKRNKRFGLAEPMGMDITEITGFDNLHHPEEIIKKEQEFAAKLYGAKESFFLVNGSTSGILAAVSAAVPRGGRLLLCRNAHKSVYNAAYLRQLELSYLRQDKTKIGLETAVCVQEVERALALEKADAVLITSPTYEGMVADVERIAQLVHEKGLPLIVDEAHGAHFGFHPFFPESALQKGADLVIQSVHKTLPSLTQTAVLHVGKEAEQYVDRMKVRRFLSIYQTSSPSYILMGSISKCLHTLRTEDFERYVERLQRFYEACGSLRHIKLCVLPCEQTKDRLTPSDMEQTVSVYAQDYSKLVLYTKNREWDGVRLFEILRDRYHLECEMAAKDYVLAMTSVADTDEGFERLLLALKELDTECGREGNYKDGETMSFGKGPVQYATSTESDAEEKEQNCSVGDFPETIYRISQILDGEAGETETVAFQKCAGRISAEFIYCYPPGTPLIVPGERIREKDVAYIRTCMERGLNVQGPQDYSMNYLNVVRETL